MKDNDTIIYTLREAVINAIDLAEKYKKNYAVVTALPRGYSVIGARYAKRNSDKLQIEYVTDIKF